MLLADDTASEPRRFLIPVDATLKSLLSREDTDQNVQITIDDSGPKVLSLGTESSHGLKHYDVRGNYSMIGPRCQQRMILSPSFHSIAPLPSKVVADWLDSTSAVKLASGADPSEGFWEETNRLGRGPIERESCSTPLAVDSILVLAKSHSAY